MTLLCARCPYVALHLADLLAHAGLAHGVRPGVIVEGGQGLSLPNKDAERSAG